MREEMGEIEREKMGEIEKVGSFGSFRKKLTRLIYEFGWQCDGDDMK